jgi:hypothetical protein
MRFLKVLFWLLLGGILAGFVIYNGDQRVPLHLWGGLIADFSLPLIMILVFLLGFLPMLIGYQALKWRSRQRIAGLERALEVLRATPPAPPPVYAPADEPAPTPPPPAVTEGNLL